MHCLHVEIRGKSLLSFGPVKIAFLVNGLRRTKLGRAQFRWGQKSVVVFQLEDSVIVFAAEVFQRRYRIAVKVVAKLKVWIKLNCESKRRRNVFVDLSDDQAGTKLAEDRIQHPIIVAVDIEAKHAKILLDSELS